MKTIKKNYYYLKTSLTNLMTMNWNYLIEMRKKKKNSTKTMNWMMSWNLMKKMSYCYWIDLMRNCYCLSYY